MTFQELFRLAKAADAAIIMEHHGGRQLYWVHVSAYPELITFMNDETLKTLDFTCNIRVVSKQTKLVILVNECQIKFLVDIQSKTVV